MKLRGEQPLPGRQLSATRLCPSPPPASAGALMCRGCRAATVRLATAFCQSSSRDQSLPVLASSSPSPSLPAFSHTPLLSFLYKTHSKEKASPGQGRRTGRVDFAQEEDLVEGRLQQLQQDVDRSADRRLFSLRRLARRRCSLCSGHLTNGKARVGRRGGGEEGRRE